MADARHLAEISSTLLAARRAAQALPGFPGTLPNLLADAYEVQRLSREQWPDDVAGWKVGGMPPAPAALHDTTHLTGPIFRSAVHVAADSSGPAPMPIYEGGFAAIEPEFIIELGASRAEDRMFIGVEIASSPLPAINDIGPLAVICDFGNNNGLMLGPEVPDWQQNGGAPVTVECFIDGALIGSKHIADIRVNARRSVAFWLAHAQRHGLSTAPGTYISTGAITGIHEARCGSRFQGHFGDLGSVELLLEQAQAR